MDALSFHAGTAEISPEEPSRRGSEGRSAPPAPIYGGAQSRQQAPAPGARVNTQPGLLAVGVGPAPVQTTSSIAAAILQSGLTQRSALTRMSQVLSIERPVAGSRSQSAVHQKVDIQLPGASRPEPAATQAAPPIGAGRLISTSARSAQPEDSRRAELRAQAELGRQHAQNDQTTRESAERASEIAPSTGAVQDSDHGRAGSSAAQASSAGRAVVEREFTQASIVEAERNDAIVTRYLSGSRTEEPAPTPHTREQLGERSVPISTYA